MGGWALLACLCLPYLSLATQREEVTFPLGPLGDIVGVSTATKSYPDAPHSNRPLYKFRNLPYIEGSIAGEHRFTQSSVRVSPYTNSSQPYDATKSGPMCMQGTLGSLHLETVFEQSLEDFILSLIPGFPGDRLLVEVLLQVIEIFLEVLPGTLNGKKPVVEILHDWLDIDFSVAEECLSLAVWTPVRPDGEERRNLPVMFYLFGGGFNQGFSYKMGGERLAAFEDVVVVAINYRLGPLGFLCLDTEESAGNMGLLDMVVGLEWVQRYIGYFGGDPNRVTLFGDSAGAASAGHLMLSQEANGLFHQAIGGSGSALGSWAWDSQYNQESCSRDIASRVNCTSTDPGELVKCLREKDAADIAKAFTSFQGEQRGNASMGYCGTQPCGQTKGPRMFYSADTTPTEIMMSGQYHAVPVMYGAAKDEGSFVYGTLHNEWMEKNNLTTDADFLTYEVIPTLMETVGVSQYYGVKEVLRDTYFEPGYLGDLQAMIPGFTDLLSVFFIKASAYELVQHNSVLAPSYWYDFHYDSPQKHLYNVFFLGSTPSGVDFPGATHCEEVPYIFDVEIPLIFCNLTEVINDALHCMDEGLGAVGCLAFPNGEFRSKWHDCLTGQLSGDDLQVSANTAQAFAGFAAHGYPGFGVAPWTRENPQYLRIDVENSVEVDYSRQYHIALEQSRNRTRSREEL